MSQNPEHPKSKTLNLLQSDPNSIIRSPLNSSSSKMQYSIPKSKRFIELKPNQGKFYDIPDTKSDRRTSLGYGKKLEMGKELFQKPPPGAYQIRSEFQTDRKKGITISAGREIIKSNSAFEIVKGIPGPGQYNPPTSLFQQDEHDHKGFSLGAKIKDSSNKWSKIVPGPGAYETLQLLDKNLKSSNSRIKNVRSAKFSTASRQSSFQAKIKQKVPGPGQYQKAENDSLVAKFVAKNGYRFSRGEREGLVKRQKVPFPGPGAYQSFSEFLH